MIYAYMVSLNIKDTVNTESVEFLALMEQRRIEFQNAVALYGGDPLSGQGINAVVEGHSITVEWRLEIGPDRKDLIQTIKDFTEQFTTISDWTVMTHLCGNGRRKKCEQWTLLMENTNE